MKLNPEQEQVADHLYGRILTLAGPGSGKTRTLTERTGRLIRKNVDPGAILCLTFTNKARDEFKVVRKYVDVLRNRNQCDFSGLLSETVRLLRTAPEVRAKLQSRFRFIQVDEFQDTNRAQNEIVELIGGSEDNVLAVGDGDQSIYEGRGAPPDGISRVIKNRAAKSGSSNII